MRNLPGRMRPMRWIMKPKRSGLESGSRIKKPRGRFVVGIGASAGGLEAIEELLRNISDINAALVVVQHLSPHYASALTQLLARNSKIGIVTATDGTVLEANRIYVIPPERRSFHIPRDSLPHPTRCCRSSLSYRPFFQVAR